VAPAKEPCRIPLVREADVFRFLSAFVIAICVVVLAVLPPALFPMLANP